MSHPKYRPEEVLCIGSNPKSRSTVRTYYLAWRKTKDLPNRCDNPLCKFHIKPLVWNRKPLTPILDHVSGNSLDNSPGNLRLLCPNCDSQNETRGGGNIGRIQKRGEFGYEVQNRNGTRGAHVFASAAQVQVLPAEGTAHVE
jgi:hypothetical protein